MNRHVPRGSLTWLIGRRRTSGWCRRLTSSRRAAGRPPRTDAQFPAASAASGELRLAGERDGQQPACVVPSADELQPARPSIVCTSARQRIAGWPDMLNGCVRHSMAARTACRRPPISTVAVPMRLRCDSERGQRTAHRHRTRRPPTGQLRPQRLPSHVVLGEHVASGFQSDAHAGRITIRTAIKVRACHSARPRATRLRGARRGSDLESVHLD